MGQLRGVVRRARKARAMQGWGEGEAGVLTEGAGGCGGWWTRAAAGGTATGTTAAPPRRGGSLEGALSRRGRGRGPSVNGGAPTGRPDRKKTALGPAWQTAAGECMAAGGRGEDAGKGDGTHTRLRGTTSTHPVGRSAP